MYGDLAILYPKPYFIYLRGTINPKHPTNWNLKASGWALCLEVGLYMGTLGGSIGVGEKTMETTIRVQG